MFSLAFFSIKDLTARKHLFILGGIIWGIFFPPCEESAHSSCIAPFPKSRVYYTDYNFYNVDFSHFMKIN